MAWRRFVGFLFTATLPLSLICGAISPLAAQPLSSPPEMLDDAELTDVFFLDADRGWAVGDRGVIWATRDGGRHWQLADSPVNCRLESVFFLNEQLGWIVGGWVHPYTHKSSAVVLFTDNGGRRWVELPARTLPALKFVRFTDPRRGWAVGSTSSMYGTGIFRTEDGGHNWFPVPGPSAAGWVGATLSSAGWGLAVARDGAVGRWADTGADLLVDPRAESTQWSAVAVTPLASWLLGRNCLRTGDPLATRWNEVALADGRLGGIEVDDWRALAMIDDQAWIAGAPGANVWHFDGSSGQWRRLPTGQTLPLNDLFFLNPQRGWAVGALGTILATRDGGQHWQRQRGSRRRAAILGLFSDPRHVPYTLLARLAGDEGYVTAVDVLLSGHSDEPPFCETALEERMRAAVSVVGASDANVLARYPIPDRAIRLPTDVVIAHWESALGPTAVEQLEQYVVRKIRQWRPDVIITENAFPDGSDPLAHVVNQLVLRAVERAADEDLPMGGSGPGGLPSWRVRKVIAMARRAEQGSMHLETSRLATRLGGSVGDFASAARSYLDDHWKPPPVRLGFELLQSEMPAELGRKDIFSAVAVIAGGEARRESAPPTGTSLESLSKLAQRRRNIQALLNHAAKTTEGGMAWLAQVRDLTRGLDRHASGEVLYQLAETYRRHGQMDLAADALTELLRQHSDHELAETAILWLIRFYGSAEMGYSRDDSPAIAASYVRDPESVAPEPISPSSKFASERQRNLQSLLDYVRRQRPELYSDPRVRMVAAASARQHNFQEASAIYQNMLHAALPFQWRQCARGEQWLLDGKGLSPKPIIDCPRVEQRPYLDGELSDHMWTMAKPVLLTSARQDDDGWTAEVRIAYDHEFLFWAAQCSKAEGATYLESLDTRPRDPDLGNHDRIQLLLDVDRDYVTWYAMTVDHRGWASDACNGDLHWDPAWYISSQSRDGHWTMEAAIPWSEVVSHPPRQGDVFGLGLQRVVPQVGFQSWSEPAAVEAIPQGFGYLRFR